MVPSTGDTVVSYLDVLNGSHRSVQVHKGSKTLFNDFLIVAGHHCIRTGAEDHTNGFFVAVFERLKSVSSGEEMTVAMESDIQRYNTHEQSHTKIDRNSRIKHRKRKRRYLPVTASR